MSLVNLQKLLKPGFKLLILAVMFSQTVYAGGGKLTGKITDKKSGEALGFANVIITHIMQDGKETILSSPMGARSDGEGYYVILNIPPGEYTVKASIVGYTPVVLKEVRVDPDRTISFNFELEPSSIQTGEIVVTARKEIIKADVSGTQQMISSETLQSLPVVRVDEFLGKLKGIQLTSSSDGYGLSVRGGAIRETDIRLDDISLKDPRSENSYLGFNSTTINEIQVVTGGFEAKYGGVRSGLLNIRTKDGNRERFTVSIKTDYTPEGQYRFFGTNPFSNDSWIYKVYSGQYAYTGAPADSTMPADLKDFLGWKKTINGTLKALDTLQRKELWDLQHPQYGVARRPDMVIEGTITGPFIIPNTAFMTAFKYENSQFVYPLGPRDSYQDWNGQLKLTTTLDNSKISVNGMLAKIYSNTSGQNVSYDESQRFGYMNNNSPSAITRQAALFGGTNFPFIYNKSRFQYFDQTFAMGGLKFTHVPMPNAFFSLDFQMGYTGQNITPMLMDMNADSSKNYIKFYSASAKRWFVYNSPTAGLPNGTTLLADDGITKFKMYGGGQWADSSYSYNYQLKGDFTWQFNRFNQFQAGFSAGLQQINVYAGSWNQSVLSFTPNSWQYFKATPIDIGMFVQDKLEFDGMILNAGLRMDYFNPMRKGYQAGFPEDKDYTKLYTDIYNNLPGAYNSFERWLIFRDLLGSPPGWPDVESKAQIKFSPRLGVAFPITENSKMYFNYGHFYQRPAASILYNMKLNANSTVIPTPDLSMARTVQYEFGYEQVLPLDFLINVTAYYKDISNEPMSRVFMDYYETNQVTKYYPDRYSDVRGVEMRFERNAGRFVTFSAMYDYMITSEGYAGFSSVYENLVKYRENKLRTASQYTPKPRPRANINLFLHTPDDYGILFGRWLANFFFEWRDGGQVLLNSDQSDIKLQKWIDVVNWWNIDFRLSKELSVANSMFELSLTVKNLTNNKWLSTENMTQAESGAYRKEMENNGGQWGDYKSPNLAKIFQASWENVLFLNPRRVVLGVRVNL
ncbi:MAG: carboxypeptidase regulatory-like domain-containing protein [Syntrophomonadaceae bacterium]